MKGLASPEIEQDRVLAQLEHVGEIHRSLWLSKQAILRMVSLGDQMKAALAYRREFPEEGKDPAELEERARRADEMAALAKSEVESDFPILHGQTAVSLWGMFEAILEDFCIEWMESYPRALDNPQICRLKLPLVQFINMNKREQCRVILHELQRATGVELAAGVTVAEKTLDVFGLVPTVEPDLRRNIFELHQVRNVVVHRGGIADKKFVDACPWTGIVTSARIQLGTEDYRRYAGSVDQYLSAVVRKAASIRKAASTGGRSVPDS